MDSDCDLIDFDGDLEIPMEGIAPKAVPSNATPLVSCETFTRRRSFEGAFSQQRPFRAFKAEPVPMEVDNEHSFLTSYHTPQHTFDDTRNFIYGGHRNYEDAFFPSDQVQSELMVSLCNLGLDVPAELADPIRPAKKVIRRATRARVGGLHKYSRPAVVQGEFSSKSPRQYLFIFAHFNPNWFFGQLGTGPARQIVKNVRHSTCDKRVPPVISRVPPATWRRTSRPLWLPRLSFPLSSALHSRLPNALIAT